MHSTIKNLNDINSTIKEKIKEYMYENYYPNIVAVSKTFKIEHINHLIEFGHKHFGENKVQETIEKWSEIKKRDSSIKLHMLGKLQTNKVKLAVRIFDYIHSVDSLKLAKKISEEQKKYNKQLSLFLQVNIGNEAQKSGINKNNLLELVNFCNENKLKIIGLMCLPPFEKDSSPYFDELKNLNNQFNFKEISMGMSHDYETAVKYKSTFLRIGSKIFGERN